MEILFDLDIRGGTAGDVFTKRRLMPFRCLGFGVWGLGFGVQIGLNRNWPESNWPKSNWPKSNWLAQVEHPRRGGGGRTLNIEVWARSSNCEVRMNFELRSLASKFDVENKPKKVGDGGGV